MPNLGITSSVPSTRYLLIPLIGKATTMRNLGIKLLLAPSIILLVFSAGCELSGPPPQPQLTKSQFYEKCSDWPALIDRCVPDKDTVVGNKVPGSSAGTHGKRMHHHSSCYCRVSSTLKGVGKMADSLKTEVNKVAQQLGVEIDEESMSKATGGDFGSYEFEYTLGNAHGRVTITVDDAKSDPDKPGNKTFPLTTKIDEWVR